MTDTSPEKIYLLLDEAAFNLGGNSSINSTARQRIQEIMPELSLLADLALDTIPNTGNAKNWVEIGKKIITLSKKSAGFILVCPPENILYLASYLAFSLPLGRQNIIYTTTNLHTEHDTIGFGDNKFFTILANLNFKTNLINAIAATNMNLSQPALILGTKIFNPLRATFNSSQELHPFETLAAGKLAEISFGINTKKSIPETTAQSISKTTKIFGLKIATDVALVRSSFTIEPEQLATINQDKKAIVIEASSAQSVQSLITAINTKTNNHQQIIVHLPDNQNLPKSAHSTSLRVNQNIIYCKGLPIEALTAKVMWLLGHTNNLTNFLTKNFRGELRPKRP